MLPISPLQRISRYSLLTKVNVLLLVAIVLIATANFASAAAPANNSVFTMKAVSSTGEAVSVPVSINIRTTDQVLHPYSGTANASGHIIPFYSSSKWNVEVKSPQVPANYTIIGDKCVNSAGATVAESSAGANTVGYIHIMNLPNTYIFCTFTLKKGTTPPTGKANISMDLTASAETAQSGDSVTFTFVVKNTGTVKLTKVNIKSPQFQVPFNPSKPYLYQLPDLAPGASSAPQTLDFAVSANTSGEVVYEAVASGIAEGGQPYTDEVEALGSVSIAVEVPDDTEPSVTNSATVSNSVAPSVTNSATVSNSVAPSVTNSATVSNSVAPSVTNSATVSNSVVPTVTLNTVPSYSVPTSGTSVTTGTSATTATTPVSVKGTQVTSTPQGASTLPFTGSQSMFLCWFALVLVNGGYVLNASLKHLKKRHI